MSKGTTRITTPEGRAEWYRQELERLTKALKRYDDEIALCSGTRGPTTEEWESIKDAWRQARALLCPDEPRGQS